MSIINDDSTDKLGWLGTFGSAKPSKPRACTLHSRGVPHNVLTQHRCCASFSHHTRLSVTNVNEPVAFATPPKQRAKPSESLWVLKHHRLDRDDCCGILNMVNLLNHSSNGERRRIRWTRSPHIRPVDDFNDWFICASHECRTFSALALQRKARVRLLQLLTSLLRRRQERPAQRVGATHINEPPRHQIGEHTRHQQLLERREAIMRPPALA